MDDEPLPSKLVFHIRLHSENIESNFSRVVFLTIDLFSHHRRCLYDLGPANRFSFLLASRYV